MKYGLTTISSVPVRRDPSHRSEMVNQLLFGEYYRVVEEEGDWLRVNSGYDNYEGWISRNQHYAFTEEDYNKRVTFNNYVLTTNFCRVVPQAYPPLMLSAGSDLAGFDPVNRTFNFLGNITRIDSPVKAISSVAGTAMSFLGAPYLWGGRSVFGCDCSGLVQVVHKIHGIWMPRDASQQAEQGVIVSGVGDALPGDLAFFTNDGISVTHVAIFTGPGRVIHASGRVRIDIIDETGIFNIETNNYSHWSYVIQRIHL